VSLRSVVAFEAFSSGPSTIESFSYNSGSLQGTQTAALIAGSGPASPRTKTESYNGSGFSAAPDLTNGRGAGECGGGAGTATAALCYNGTPGGGPILNYIEEFNGTSWSEQNDLNTGRVQVSGAGIETAALVFSGQTSGGSTVHNETEEYNGTSWSEQNNLSTSVRNAGGGGIQTSAICLGGVSGSTVYNNTEEYDGTSWTAGTNYPTNVRGASIIASTSSDALALGGNNPPSAIPAVGVRRYDGTTWTSTADLASSKINACGIGTTSAGLSIGNNGSTGIGAVEEFSKSINTITAAAFASGGSMNNARRYFSGFGTQTAAVAHGGSPALNTVEHYNGSSWSNATAMPATYSGQGASGTQTSGLVFGGSGGPSNPGIKGDTFEYNGSSWTSGGAMVVARNINQGRSSAGTQTAALGFGGYAPGGARSETEEYDGNSWTAGGALPAARNHGGGSGTQTSALAFGGLSPGLVSTGLAYDGSSWTQKNLQLEDQQKQLQLRPSMALTTAVNKRYI
jgi:hypothetical protein